ncbi:hypothetical protein COO60DRAFT_1456659 [Scenedesmus sp. NREL 46B-D3]|nr:hypothetical protein COO60DRAFT_1456659 [Scenedesmus sp. NREL 46B-D3]
MQQQLLWAGVQAQSVVCPLLLLAHMMLLCQLIWTYEHVVQMASQGQMHDTCCQLHRNQELQLVQGVVQPQMHWPMELKFHIPGNIVWQFIEFEVEIEHALITVQQRSVLPSKAGRHPGSLPAIAGPYITQYKPDVKVAGFLKSLMLGTLALDQVMSVDPLVQDQITATAERVPRTGATNLNFGGVSKRTYQMTLRTDRSSASTSTAGDVRAIAHPSFGRAAAFVRSNLVTQAPNAVAEGKALSSALWGVTSARNNDDIFGAQPVIQPAAGGQLPNQVSLMLALPCVARLLVPYRQSGAAHAALLRGTTYKNAQRPAFAMRTGNAGTIVSRDGTTGGASDQLNYVAATRWSAARSQNIALGSNANVDFDVGKRRRAAARK